MTMMLSAFPDIYDARVTVKIMDGIGAQPAAWEQYFNQSDEHQLEIRTTDYSGFGKVPVWKDGADLPVDEALKIGSMTMAMVFYGAGFKITRKMGPGPEGYGQLRLIDRLAASLARSANQTYGLVHVATLDVAFTTALASLGAKTLISATHLTAGSGSRSNLLAAAALTPANLTALKLKAAKWVNYRGLHDPIDMVGAKLIYPSDLASVAEKLLGSAQEPGTANNDKNVHAGKFIPVEEARLTSTTAYFIQAQTHGLLSNHGLRPTPISYYENNGSLVKGVQFDFTTGVEFADGMFGCAGA